MPFAGAIHRLNGLRDSGVIPDYVLIGAVAATAYMEPVFTEDLDVAVLVDSDEQYLEAFRRASAVAERTEESTCSSTTPRYSCSRRR